MKHVIKFLLGALIFFNLKSYMQDWDKVVTGYKRDDF